MDEMVGKIEAALQAATDGPWVQADEYIADDDGNDIATVIDNGTLSDAALIVLLRNNAAALLAERRELVAKVEAAEAKAASLEAALREVVRRGTGRVCLYHEDAMGMVEVATKALSGQEG